MDAPVVSLPARDPGLQPPAVVGAPRYRVLIAHNAYQQRGGEDAVVEAEQALLAAHGHTVSRYQRHNDESVGASRLGLFADALWSRRSYRELTERIERERPDVIHVHNTFARISPSIYWAAHAAGVPVVQTIHNFRLICPQALLLRDGRVCEDCVGRAPWPAVRHRCYRGSAAQSATAALTLQAHRTLGTWRDKVTLYIALNAFCRDKLIEGGLPAERIRIKPNFLDGPPPPAGERAGLLFVGRLSGEKGVEVLAEAMRRLAGSVALRVVGEGPMAATLAGAPGVTMLGALPPEAVYREMRSAHALVLPSIWYENFPRTLVEAYANGLPVIASRLGALVGLVTHERTGLLFAPGDAVALADAMRRLADQPHTAASMGAEARRHFEQHYGTATNHGLLMSIYAEAIERTKC